MGAMWFDVFQREDRRWLVMPAVLRRPDRLACEGELSPVGTATLEFDRLSDELALAISLRGYGVAQAADEVRIRRALDDTAAPRGG